VYILRIFPHTVLVDVYLIAAGDVVPARTQPNKPEAITRYDSMLQETQKP